MSVFLRDGEHLTEGLPTEDEIRQMRDKLRLCITEIQERAKAERWPQDKLVVALARYRNAVNGLDKILISELDGARATGEVLQEDTEPPY